MSSIRTLSSRISTEHARAWRAEIIGAILVVVGIFWKDATVCAIGAALLAVTTASYSAARAGHKAAASRPANVLANPRA